MGRDVRSLVWYERWGDFISDLRANGLSHDHAATAARAADDLLDRSKGYGTATVAAGAARALEAACEHVANGSYAAWKASRQEESQGERAETAVLRSQESEAFRALADLALMSANIEGATP